jgi:hypothetical protein
MVIFSVTTAVLAVVGLLATAVVSARSAQPSTQGPIVTFASQPGVATLLAHYQVNMASVLQAPRASAAHAATAQSAVPDRELPFLSPKGTQRNAVRKAAAANVLKAGQSNNSVPEVRPASHDDGTPPPSASFIGQQSSKSTCSYFGRGCNPPDMAIAASPTLVLQGVNTQFEVLDPSGTIQAGWPKSAQNFFGVPNEPGTCDAAHQNQPFLSDPRAFYDPQDRRFWAAVLQVENAIGIAPGCPLKTAYYIAVSQTSDPRGAWNVYEFDMSLGTTNVADFTQIGFNGAAIYFSANMFTQDGSAYSYAEIFEANKAQMEAGAANFTADGFFNLTATGPGATFLADTVQPVLTIGGRSEGEDRNNRQSGEFFVDTFDGPDPVTNHFCTSAADACQGLALWQLSNPIGHDLGGSAPVLTGTYIANTRPFVFSPPADQPGCTQCIDASDLRISAIPVYRQGTIYAAWETALDNGTQIVPAIEWAQIQVANADKPSGTQSFYYNFSGDAAAIYPVLMPDNKGNLVMLFDYTSSSVFPQTRYTLRNSKRGQFTDQGVLLKAGEAPYRPGVCGSAVLPVCRWGDFSAATYDGSDTNDIWVAGQYANGNLSSTDPNFSSRNWGTWIGEIQPH